MSYLIQNDSFDTAVADGGRRKEGHDVAGSDRRCRGATMMLE